MIKIIKPGKNLFKARCPLCECEFAYETEDVNTETDFTSFCIKYIKCPYCGEEIKHSNNGEIKIKKLDEDNCITTHPDAPSMED